MSPLMNFKLGQPKTRPRFLKLAQQSSLSITTIYSASASEPNGWKRCQCRILFFVFNTATGKQSCASRNTYLVVWILFYQHDGNVRSDEARAAGNEHISWFMRHDKLKVVVGRQSRNLSLSARVQMVRLNFLRLLLYRYRRSIGCMIYGDQKSIKSSELE